MQGNDHHPPWKEMGNMHPDISRIITLKNCDPTMEEPLC